MSRFRVRIINELRALRFTDIVNRYPTPVRLKTESEEFDAKSILCVLGLGLEKPATLYVDRAYAGRLRKELDEFLVHHD